MKTVPDFEDMLAVLDKHGVRNLVIGGVAFIYHVKPRYTKDIDIWVSGDPENLEKANIALAEFGSPHLLDTGKANQVVQIGVAPNRIDILTHVEGPSFDEAWSRRIRSTYGKAPVNWIDLDSLIDIKGRIADPRHASDVEYLRQVKAMKGQGRGGV